MPQDEEVRLRGLGRRHREARRTRQAIQDQYPLQIVRQGNTITTAVVGYVPNVDQSFGGLFKPSSPAPGRTQPKCVKKKLPWQGKIKVVRNGVDHEAGHQVGR